MLGTNHSKITPTYYSKLCGTTGILTFLIKNSLEYAGIILEKKPNQLRILKNLLYQQTHYTKQIEKLQALVKKL